MNDRIVRGLGALAFGAALLTASLAAQAANLVANGDFDDTTSTWIDNTGLGADDLQSAGGAMVPGWSATPGFANDFWAATPNSYGITQSPGNGSSFWIDLTGQANNKPYGGIQQAVATTAGTTYVLTFDVGSSTLYNGSGLGAAALTASASGATTDGSMHIALTPSTTNDWTSESLTFTADSNSTTISFLADSSFTSRYTGLDNVSVTQVATSPVPEPASFTMLLAGLAGVAGLARMRRRS